MFAELISAVNTGRAQGYMAACFYVRSSDEFTSGGDIRSGRKAAPLHVYLHFHGRVAT